MKINNKSMLSIQLERLKKCKNVFKLIVATTDLEADKAIVNEAILNQVDYATGSEHDVLDRFYQAAKKDKPSYIVRLTGDCPLIDPVLVDEVINYAKENRVDYCSNVLIEDFPDGQDVEVFTYETLEKAWQMADKTSEREHVTPFIRNNSDFANGNLFSAINFPCPGNYSHIRMTVDETEDFKLMEDLIGKVGIDQSWKFYADYIISNELYKYNSDIARNEGYLKSIDQEKSQK